jgi:predicted transcriptional regulator
MTRLLEQAFAKLSGLPEAAQDDLARLILRLAGEDQAPVRLTAEEERDLAEALAEAERGELVSHEAVEAVLAKYA